MCVLTVLNNVENNGMEEIDLVTLPHVIACHLLVLSNVVSFSASLLITNFSQILDLIW